MRFGELLRWDTPTARLRAIAFLEGSSFLLLLFVAMPLKYLADLPLAVRVVGMGHGVLFLALAGLGAQAVFARGKGVGWGARLALASLLPFGTFLLDRGLAEDDRAYRAATR